MNAPRPTLAEQREDDRCQHVEQWRAADGKWRCLACQPPMFPGEVRERTTLDALFRDERRRP